jgi:hypothetical protein
MLRIPHLSRIQGPPSLPALLFFDAQWGVFGKHIISEWLGDIFQDDFADTWPEDEHSNDNLFNDLILLTLHLKCEG